MKLDLKKQVINYTVSKQILMETIQVKLNYETIIKNALLSADICSAMKAVIKES